MGGGGGSQKSMGRGLFRDELIDLPIKGLKISHNVF